MTDTLTLDPGIPHRFHRGPDKSWQCLCGKNHKSRVHHDGETPTGGRQATASPGTVSACKAEAGQLVVTTDVNGTDFGLPLVEPTRRRGGGVTREVRSHLRESGGVVVRFTDGTKTRPINGHTALVLAPPAGEQTAEVGTS